ncbi:MAG: 23S rRNA (adenine(2503)-C(2))-methyltransferase RlmN [Candidatus Endonucleobacter sp. (ex Gigantidas childressi)]|nr:23S rRNA (adenine(2503)-C(2))-methyltransferase RlmN [Candidatus Endonucleobacter sp. (ex Gigantidas childressi)]
MSEKAVIAKTNLLGLSRAKMEAFFLGVGEKEFRARQVLKWVHHNGVDSFDKMSNISKGLRDRLNVIAEITGPKVVSSNVSEDGTCKWVICVEGGSYVETVYIPEGRRGTLCVSSQAGCSLDCSFCSTGKQGFSSDLTVAEIIGQVWIAAKHFDNIPDKKGRAITNVVMMGMGEPLLNFDNVVDAMNLMMDDLGYGLSKRRVTLSTSGVVPALRRLGSVSDVSLAISLHAPNNALRNQLVPINKKYPLEELLDAAVEYMSGVSDKGRVVTIEYVLLAGVNDQQEHARQMVVLLKDVPCKINLIPFNPFPYSGYERPGGNAVRRFQESLQKSGFNVTVRKTRGDDIDAACGQLVGRVNDITKRSARHIAVRQLGADIKIPSKSAVLV